MSAIGQVDPAAAGMNPERLRRIPSYFDSYIQKKKLPCCAVLVARGGQVAHLSFQGATEMGGGKSIGEDTIYRIYSMTKPVTSVAAMMLFEEGALRLDHEVHRYIPEFQDVMVHGPDGQLRKPDRPMMVRDLFLHTSGLSYAFLQQGPVDAIYRERGLEHFSWKGDLKSFCEALAQAPLVFSPGRSGTIRTRPTCWGAWSKWRRG
jgi:CubicO group peptidase (beta-lactamase class C family)